MEQTARQDKQFFRSNAFRMLLVAFVGFVALFILNHYTPFISDDYGYSRVSSVKQAFEWSYLRWFTINGRVPMTLLLLLLHLLPTWVFDVFNAALFPLLCWLITVLAKGSVKKVTAREYGIVSLASFFALPMIGSTCLWVAGAASYLWPATLVLAFLLPYRLCISEKYKSSKNGSTAKKIVLCLSLCVLMAIAGLLAGWSTECTGLGAVVVTTLYIGLSFKDRKWLPAWAYVGWLTSIIGLCLVVFAPGISVRQEHAAAELGIGSSSILSLLKTNLPQVPFSTIGHNLPFVLFALFALLIVWRFRKRPGSKRWPIIFLVSSIASMLPAFVNASSRAQFFGGVLAVTAFFAFTFPLQESFGKRSISRFTIVLLLLCIVAFGLGFIDTLRLYTYDLERKEIALEQIKRGKTENIELPSLHTPRWMVLNQWSATWEESFYGMSLPNDYVRTLGGKSAKYSE